jgi:Ca2+-transporting ATPase
VCSEEIVHALELMDYDTGVDLALGFIQEYRAERAMAALKKFAASSARVLRDGVVAEIPAIQLVPGDIVLIEAGSLIPADLRLIESALLRVEEAALTGESVPAEKHVRPLDDAEAPLGDRRNMAYKGTIAVYGRARGLVVGTGMQTELGKIAALLGAGDETRTPLQKRLAYFSRKLALAALGICVAMFVLGVLRGEAVALMFLTAVSLAVAAIPEALPAVVTISLALGAHKMVKQNALIRKLPAVETLGSVTYICSDKTGTLTQNRMRVEEIYSAGKYFRQWPASADQDESVRLLFTALALNNDAALADNGKEIGDPTEIALLQAAQSAGHDRTALEAATPRIAELPFDSERKRMTTFHRIDGASIAYTKGAPEKILECCQAVQPGDGAEPVARAATLTEVESVAEKMASAGLRVMAIAYRVWPQLPEALTAEGAETGLTFLGLVGMMDPPRPEAQQAVALCRSAGITPVMVTGDHPATARAIAERLGILDQGARVVTGKELARLSPAEFASEVKDIRVYARVDPAQKIRIIEALQAQGEFVAMTGDGVNDAPALKRADIGVAMGKIGTDVAREASHMVLLDDNFTSIVAAVREGRRIYDNVRKFIRFVMGGNSGEIWAIFIPTLLGMPLPLLPIQILWINLVTDGLPGLALAAEAEEKGIMQRPPRPPGESVFAHGMWQHILWVGLLMGALCVFTQSWALRNSPDNWQTMVFTVLTMCQMYHVLAIRSERESLFSIGVASNRLLLGAVALTFALQLAIIYIPELNPIFETTPLSLQDLAWCVLLPSVVFFGVEIEKWMLRQAWIYQEPVISTQAS